MSSSDCRPQNESAALSGQLESETIVAIGSFLLLQQRDTAGLWGQVRYCEVRHQTQALWARQEWEEHNES